MDERRKFERINLPSSAQVFVERANGKPLGDIVVIGRGGMLVKTDDDFLPNTKLKLYLVDDSEGIRREVQAVTRYKLPDGMGFEFEQLDPDAAVEIGVIIGKYYSATQK